MSQRIIITPDEDGKAMAYDPVDDMLKIKSLQKKFRDSFVGTSLDTTKWSSVIGAGGTVSVGSGLLTVGSGTTINSETYVLSEDNFTIPFRLSIGLGFTQRIINQTFFVEAVSIDPVTGIPDGKHICAFVFDGTNAAQGKYRVGNGSMTPLDSALSTLPTTTLTASLPVSVYEMEPFADECWFHGSTLDSTNARSNSYRRHQQIPDPNAVYKLRLRWLNGGTAPATSTNAVVQFVACQDYAELTAEITAGRGQSVAGQAIGVQVAGGSLGLAAGSQVVGYTYPAAATSNGATNYFLISLASTNAAVIKASAGQIYSYTFSNSGATDAFVKLYNKTTAPVIGTDIPVMIVLVRAGQTESLACPVSVRFATGIGIGITGAMASADVTAVAANQVSVSIHYA